MIERLNVLCPLLGVSFKRGFTAVCNGYLSGSGLVVAIFISAMCDNSLSGRIS